MSTYRSAPEAITTAPKGIPYIVTNEAAERFSFYGMRGILVVFMTQYLLTSKGAPDYFNQETAKIWYHNFTSAVYFFPLIGALISDWFFGKYKTIMALSVVYCLGHLSLAFMDLHMPWLEPRNYLMIGLTLIAVGAGGIKPCVSAHVGDQFGKRNAHLLEKIFGWFYIFINLGAFFSSLLTPKLLSNPKYGPAWAFGVPGVLMALATVFFWMGRKVFIHIPAGGTQFIKETFSAKGIGSLAKLFVVYLFVAMFWALFDQTGSAWVLQAEKMDREFWGFEWLSSQIQAINPIMILVLVPIFNTIVYPAVNKVFTLTPLRKIGLGFFLTVPAFLLPAWIEMQIAQGEAVNIVWQLFAYVLMTAAEIFVSITCLEFSYTQSPKKMKSFIMATYLFSVSLGNQFVSFVNMYIQTPAAEIEMQETGLYVFALDADDGVNKVHKEIKVNVVKEKEESVPTEAKKEEKPPSVTFAEPTLVVKPNGVLNIFAMTDFGEAQGDVVYSWKVQGTSATVSNENKRFTRFQATQNGEYTVVLTMTVGDKKAENLVTVKVGEDNLEPIVVLADSDDFAILAKCGGFSGVFDADCTEKQSYTLDASGSYDPNGDDVQYQWSIVSQPAGSSLTNADISNSKNAFSSSILQGADYYNFFALCMLITSVLFVPYAMRYKEETYIQDDTDAV